MGQVKPWQIVVIVVAIIAAGTSAYLTLRGEGGPKMEDHVLLVDVTSGELWAFPTGGHKAIVTPATNPETGKRALFTVYKNDSGDWMVSGRELSGLSVVEGETKALDRKSGRVNVTNETPKWMK